jgi:MoaA/NifB/PqqE/SkfB family radical SAM enzyme
MVKGAYNKIKKPDGTFYTCKDDFIKEAWNSQDMKTIRLAMIDGKQIEGCSVCYDQEANGRTSNRQHSIQEWSWRLGNEGLNKLITEAIENNGHLDSEPVYLDLRLGNLCNLKCRMCNPWNSSQIVKEHESLAQDSAYSEVWRKTFGKFPVTVMDDQQWFDHDILWDQVISLIPTLKKVYMTGGEPTLIKNNFKFMKACIEQGRTDIVLFFNTNCTNINKQFLELISQFKQVNIARLELDI